MTVPTVVIIGAGPAGLTAAYELARLGLPATILEAEDQVGGLARTVTYRGYRFDIGGHRLLSKVPEINVLWQQLLGPDLLLCQRRSRIYYRARFFDYPLRAGNVLANLGPVEVLRVLWSYATARLWPEPDERTFAQWVSNRFGERLYQIFFQTYTEKVWGIPGSEITADWAAQRIKNLSLGEAVRQALTGARRAKDGSLVTTLSDHFYYPRLGPGMLWERCEALVARWGTPTRRSMRVERIVHRRGRVEAVIARTGTSEMVEVPASQFISTMALADLMGCLDPPPPPAVRHAARQLHYRDFLTVVLILKRATVFPDHWLYIHAPEVKLGRIQNYKNWSPAMVPDDTHTALGLEYFLWEAEEEWAWSTERLIERGIRECVQIGLVERREVEDGTVVRMPKAYPVYDAQYRDHVATVRRYLEQMTNLQTIGRNGLHRYNNQDHSMLTGLYAARNCVGEHHDVWAVNTDLVYHEMGTLPALTSTERSVPTRVVPLAVD